MISDLAIVMVVEQSLDPHTYADHRNNNQGDGCIPLSVDSGYDIDSEDGCKYLNQPHKHLVEVDVESEFVQAQQGTIVDEFHCEIDDSSHYSNQA